MLELDQLTKRYGAVTALDGLTFDVAPGQMFGFLGANGAGKTTAMRIVMGVAATDGGEVRWNGHEVTQDDRVRFGYMPEERGLYPKMQVREQLVYLARLHGLSASRAQANTDRWLATFELSQRADSKVEELSLGNQQRVQLAAALVHEPDLLVLDEAFSGLDPIAVDTLGKMLLEHAGAGATVLFSSHQLDLVEHLCDSVAIIDRGRLVMTGPLDDLRSSGRRRLVVELGNARTDWADRLPGAEVLERRGGRVVLRLDDDVDTQRVLRAAESAGTVARFAVEQPRLSELFLEAVAA
ncbi:MAG TPA: ATP-binding cassette domain-containing protein [Actinomycetota bacterium]